MGTLKHTNTKGVFTRNALPTTPTNTQIETRVCQVNTAKLKDAQASITAFSPNPEAIIRKYTVNLVTRAGHTVTFDILHSSNLGHWYSPQFVNTVQNGFQNRYFVGTKSAETPDLVFEAVILEIEKMIYSV